MSRRAPTSTAPPARARPALDPATIALPGSHEAATCRMVARSDTRNADAPRRLLDTCHREALTLEPEIAETSLALRKFQAAWSRPRDDMRAWFRVAEQRFATCLAVAASRR